MSRADTWTCGCLAWQDVLALAPDDLTYRQLNHWTTVLGIVPARYHGATGEHLTTRDAAELDKPIGSGFHLGWSPGDARRAAFAAQIIAATTTAATPAHRGGGNQIPVELAFRLADGPVILTIGGTPYCLSLAPLIAEITP